MMIFFFDTIIHDEMMSYFYVQIKIYCLQYNLNIGNCVLRVHIKNVTNRNYVLEIVLIYCLKCLILIFFQ